MGAARVRERFDVTPKYNDQAIDVLSDGFFDNPVLAWIFPDESTRAGAIASWFRLWIDVFGDGGIVVVSDDGQGAALWAAPDAPFIDGEGVRALNELIAGYNGDRTAFVLGGLATLPRPLAGHWYLNAIAARRGQRARGVGAGLLAPFVDRSDREGVPIYLESSNPRNLTFYYRHGFQDHGPRIDLPESGPPIQPMVRLPKAEA